MTERLHFHFSLSCIGEGDGNPLQCSCLENPGDGGAWWAAVYGVSQSWTQLKRLSSSSSKETGTDVINCLETIFKLLPIVGFHFHALQKETATHSCSCLENPRDRGAWWAAVYGVSQSLTRLKRLSSSSSSPTKVLLRGLAFNPGSLCIALNCYRAP